MKTGAQKRLWAVLLAVAVMLTAVPTAFAGEAGDGAYGNSDSAARKGSGMGPSTYGGSTQTLGLSLTSDDPAEWQTKINEAAEDLTIYLSGDVSLAGAVAISNDSRITVTFQALGSDVAITAAASRHFEITASDITLRFSGVALDGDGSGGGIQANNSTLTLEGAVLSNCYRDSSGAALAFRGSVPGSALTINGSHFKGNAAPGNDAGAILAEYADTLTMDSGTTVEGSTAKYNGGAMYIGNVGQVDIAAAFTGNKTTESGWRGGAVYVVNCGDISFDGAVFHANISQGVGGAIAAQSSDTLTISGGKYEKNKAYGADGHNNGGGAVYATGIGGAIEVEDANFKDNYAAYSGSAVSLVGNGAARITIAGGTYEQNNTGLNGTLSIENSAQKVAITGSRFVGNKAAANAGGINLAFGLLDVELEGITVQGNTAGYRGGGIAYEARTSETAKISIKDSFILGNEAEGERGGGIFLNIYGAGGQIGLGDTLIHNTLIEGNRAAADGGGVMLCNSILTVTDSTITGNHSAQNGGGIALEKYAVEETVTVGGDTKITGNTAGTDGGGIFLPYERVRKTTVYQDVTFSGNSAGTFALGFKDAEDEGVHLLQVLTRAFSNMPGTQQMFETAYNNYDINYTRDIPPESDLRVSYVGNGGIIAQSGGELYQVYAKTGDALAAPDIEREGGYTFLGWYTEDNADGAPWDFANDRVQASMTLYAQWEQEGGEEADDLLVTYIGNGGLIAASGSELHQVIVKAGDSLTAPAVRREGYTFLGWYTQDSADSALWDFANGRVQASMTLYAQWEQEGGEETEDLRIVYVGNGGLIAASGSELHQVVVKAGDSLTAPAVRREGYTFLGWYTQDNTDSALWDFQSGRVERSMTLYAQWRSTGSEGGGPGGGGNAGGGFGGSGGGSAGGGGTSSGGRERAGSSLRDIYDEDIPLAEELLTLIEDGDIPLASLPTTGAPQGMAMAAVLCAAALAAGAAAVPGFKKSK